MAGRVPLQTSHPTALRALSLSAALIAFAVSVLGGIVRIKGAGMTCPDWPRCRGVWFPTLGDSVVFEWVHRFGSPMLTVLVLATIACAWFTRRRFPTAMKAAWVALGLLGAQIIAGALTIRFGNSPLSVATHLVLGASNVATLLVIAIATFERARTAVRPTDLAPLRFALLSTFAAYIALFAGGIMSAAGAGLACTGFPLCDGFTTAHSPLQQLHMGHRLAAYATLLAVALMFAVTVARRASSKRVVALASLSVGVAVLQALLGVLTIATKLEPVLRSLHQANGILLVASLVALTFVAYRDAVAVDRAPAEGEALPIARATKVARLHFARVHFARVHFARLHFRPLVATVRNYVALLKLNVMSLLLFTTFAAMVIAAGGLPSPALIWWTLLGGALAAGAAGALNMYLDRDIDALMKRTSRRPIPSGKIAPTHALIFGLTLAAAAFAVLAANVNLLAATLSTLGIAYYVVVYTIWLKRRTPQNIVIGGAAGAIPPLVGWAAVTDHLGLTAVLLFLIIFVWTPPHFWALALMAKGEYARAGIPMLPVVRGDDATKRQILIYAAAVAALTLLMVPLHLMGIVYLASAVVLDAVFLYCALRVVRTGSVMSERILYRYSMVYLALLFGAMMVDRFHHQLGA